MSQLTLVFVNNSSRPGSFVIYQTGGAPPNAGTIAWISKYAYPQTRIEFRWDGASYEFVWAATGQITPGMIIEAGEAVACDVTSHNRITLSYDLNNHIFHFKDLTQAPPAGSMTVSMDSTIPQNGAAVGIGMAGSPVYVVQAQPNLQVTFTPHPQYWVTFGDVQQGEVILLNDLLAPVQAEFPANVNSLTVTLNPDNTFKVESNILMSEDV